MRVSQQRVEVVKNDVGRRRVVLLNLCQQLPSSPSPPYYYYFPSSTSTQCATPDQAGRSGNGAVPLRTIPHEYGYPHFADGAGNPPTVARGTRGTMLARARLQGTPHGRGLGTRTWRRSCPLGLGVRG
jgi:hypothetical protein